jgi:hypothetical protein
MQTDDLTALGFGITGDQRLNTLQPAPIGNGNHIRYMTSFAKGLPWYGFYLFRRLSREAKVHCLARDLTKLKPGSTGSLSFHFPGVRVAAQDPIVFEDGFPAAGTVEIALPSVSALEARFDPAPVHFVTAKIGFRGAPPERGRICGTAQFATGSEQEPGARVVEAGVTFGSSGPAGPKLHRGTLGYLGALIAPRLGDSGAAMLVTLPVASEFVLVALSHPEGALIVRGFDDRGEEIQAARRLEPNARSFSILTFSAPGLVTLHFNTQRGDFGIHWLFYCSRNRPPVTPRAVRMIARDGQVVVAETRISGQPGAIVSGQLAADRITSVAFEPAPTVATPANPLPGVDAVLVDLCWDTVANARAGGWTQVPNYPYPMALPVAEPGYPCVGKPANQNAAEAVALARVRYGSASAWATGRAASLIAFLDNLVSGGPGGGAMNARVGTFIDPNAGPNDPHLGGQNLLELLQLVQLDPAMAQILGLYWLDDQVAPGVAYDYYVLADHGNAFSGQVAAALAAANGTLPPNVDGWITFGHAAQPRAPLASPGAPTAYVLPDTAINGVATPGRGAVGLRWNLPSLGGYLMPDAAVRYIAWRHDYGDPDPAAPAAAGFVARNPNAPFLAGGGASAAAAAIAPANWPALSFNAVDRSLADGWYGYGLSGIDIWGRYSLVGPAAEWRQTATAPNPRPWYYQDPPGDRPLHPYAVHILDKSPPPAPSAVEAIALDPEDDFTYGRDGIYVGWANATGTPWWNLLTPAQRAAVLPLRVRWRWYPAQEQQHPNTREFRIYFNPGSVPPDPDRFEPANWQERIFACAYNEHFTLVPATAPDGPYRQYDVLLPRAASHNDPPFPGVALQPSLTAPVVYANVSVSAADDRIHSDDDAKWAAATWGGRYGNESRLAAPAKIYRVWRALPPAPAALINDERVWATKADFHAQSFYSFRWPASPELKAHVYAVMDSTLFVTERAHPEAATLSAADHAALATVWSAIPTNVVLQITALRALKASLDDTGATAAQIRQHAETWAAACAALGDGALRGLAVLPLHEESYVRQTAEPVDPPDAPGPDDPAGYAPNPQWRMYSALFDGRATNRYFLRAAYIDAAHNEGPFGPPTPPIYLPPVIPPRTPVITGVKGGDRSATISWATANAEAGGRYLLYRTDDDYRLRDVRLMELVATIAVSDLAPATVQANFADTGLVGGRTYYYCLLSEDGEGNASPPSRSFAANVVDEAIPDPPAWIDQSWHLEPGGGGTLIDWPADGIVPAGYAAVSLLTWASDLFQPEFVLTRRERNATGWRAPADAGTIVPSSTGAGRYDWIDRAADPARRWEYRLRVRATTGVWSSEYAILTAIVAPGME